MAHKIFGVVEGFYGRPYTLKQRLDLIDLLHDLGMNTYVYGPKSDAFHRRRWRDPYPSRKLRDLELLCKRCKERRVDFVYALSPVYRPDAKAVIRKIKAMAGIGIRHYSLFFDDIKVDLTRETAKTQVSIVHALHAFLRELHKNATLSFCPTQYRGFRQTDYIAFLAENLSAKIDVFWTGKTVVAKSITDPDITRITRLLARPILIWDNLFANDYLHGKILHFPYRRRTARILERTRGVLLNPMNDWHASKPLIHTAAAFFRDPAAYKPGLAWRDAMRTYAGTHRENRRSDRA